MNPVPPSPSRSPGLCNLDELPLNGAHRAMLEMAQRLCGGPAVCRHRLLAEATELLALAQCSGRLTVHRLDLSDGLRAEATLMGPVPCLQDPAGQLEVAPRALLGLMYPRQAVLLPQPGVAFVRILQPRNVWHPNVSRDPNQVLCLGPKLPTGIPLKEIILMTFGALTMQTTQFAKFDPAGVLNPGAADYWQRNTGKIPLTREPFVRDEAPHVA